MTTIQPQPPQPTELAAALLKRIREVELPAPIAVGLIVLSVHEDWTPAKLRSERFKAKWRYFFERLGNEVEVEEKPEEIKMLRDGEDGDC